MSWTGPIENEEFSAPSGTATAVTFSPNATIPVGTLIVIGWSGGVNSATAATGADNSSQAGSANTYNALATQTTTGPSLAGGLLWCVTTRAILATDVVTITVPSSARRNGRLVTFTGQAVSPLDVSANEAADATSPIDIGPTATLAEVNELVISCGFVANTSPNALGASDSTSGYTLITPAGSGGTGTPTWVTMSYKTTAGTAAETDSQAYTSFNKAVGQIVAFKMLSSVSDSGTVTLVGVVSGAEAERDAATVTPVIAVSNGFEGARDAATVTAVVATSGADSLGDSATVTPVIAVSGADALRDAGTCTLVVATSGADALRDAATMTLVIATSGTGSDPTDSGTCTLVVATSGTSAIADVASTAVSAIYGESFASDGLNNSPLGNPAGYKLAKRIRMTETASITVVRAFIKTGVGGYSGGTGGTVLLEIMPDDGSGLPDTSTILASVSISPGNVQQAGVFTLGTPLPVTNGQLLYFGFRNTDGAPLTNWVSINCVLLGENLTPMQAEIADADLALISYQGSWFLDRSRDPIIDVTLDSGNHVGQAWNDAAAVTGRKDIYGTGASGHAVRQKFTTPPPASPPSTGARIRLFKRAGTTQDLTLLAKNAAGTVLATATIPASAVHLVTNQTEGYGGRWVDGTWDTPIADPSQIDRVEAWSTAEGTIGNSYQCFPIYDGSFSGVLANSPHFTGGYLEATTDGTTWAQHISGSYRMELYLVLTGDATSMVLTIAPSGAHFVVNSGTCTLVVATSGVGSLRDAGTCTLSVDGSASSYGVRDAGTCTLVIDGTGVEARGDATSTTLVIAASGAEQGTLTGTNILVIAASGVEQLADATTVTLVIAPGGIEAETDATSTALVIAPSSDEALRDEGSCSLSIDGAASEALRDATSATIVVDGTGTTQIDVSGALTLVVDSGVIPLYPGGFPGPDVYPGGGYDAGEAIADITTGVVVIAASGSHSVLTLIWTDAGTCTLVILPAPGIVIDSGTCTLAITQTALERVTDTGSVTLVLVPGDVESESDSGTSSLGIAASGTASVIDATSTTLVIAASGTDKQADSASVSFSIAGSGVEAITATGSDSFSITGTSVEQITDEATTLVVFVFSAQSGVLGASPVDAGTCTLIIDGESFDAMADGQVTIVLQPGGSPAASDEATCTLSIATTGEYATLDAATQIIVIDPTSVEAASDSATTSFVITPSQEVAGYPDSGEFDFTITGSASEQLADQASDDFLIDPSAEAHVATAGSVTFVIDPSGMDFGDDEGQALVVFSVDGAHSVTGVPHVFGTVSLSIDGSGGIGGEFDFTIDPSATTETVLHAGTAVLVISGAQLGTVRLEHGGILCADVTSVLSTCPEPIPVDGMIIGGGED